MRPYLRPVIISAISTILAGCMVGPDFHSPAAPKTNSYTEAPQPQKTVSTPAAGAAGKAQHFVAGQDIPADWWYLFHSPELNNLVTTGIANSPNIIAAKAALRQAQENLNAQIASSFYPSIYAQPTAQRERDSNASFGSTTPANIFNLYNASVYVSYTLDAFGGARRQVEALRAQTNYEWYELEAAYLTLTSNIVTTSVTIASLQAQIQATQELIQLQQDQLVIVQKQFSLGGASSADVLAQQTQVAQTRATLPPLEQMQEQNLHALSVLVGELPSESQLPKLDLNKLVLPTQLPISIPSELVRQRPDIRASEELLHEASAQVGVATANLYPQITITGNYGGESLTLPTLLSPINRTWDIGGSLLQPLYNAGSLLAKKRAAVDAYDQAAAQYRQTVLQGFQNVADSLRALENDAKTLQAQELAETAAHKSMILTEGQFRLGGVSYLSLLTAERQYQQARIGRIQAQAARYTDTAALFQALGGGWWNKEKV